MNPTEEIDRVPVSVRRAGLSLGAKRRLLFAIEAVMNVAVVSVAAAVLLAWHEPAGISLGGAYRRALPNVLIVAVVLQVAFYYNNLYDFKVIRRAGELLVRLLQAFGVAALITGALYYLFRHSMAIERGLFLLTNILLFVVVVPWRLLLRWVLRHGRFVENVLLVGATPLARDIADEVSSTAYAGYRIIGCIPLAGSDQLLRETGVPVLRWNGSLAETIAGTGTDTVIPTVPPKVRSRIVTELEALRRRVRDLRIEDPLEFYERLAGKMARECLEQPGAATAVDVSPNPFTIVAKRMIDLVMASLGLIVTLPLSLLAALAVRLTSRGPVFYVQERVGYRGRTFHLRKFRSMYPDAERDSGPVWAKERDERVTPVGRVLRKTRIDEIPQMISVLSGDMSFVGPRPERPHFHTMLLHRIPAYASRTLVRPGITGLAQVKYEYGASVEDAMQKLQYDLYYVKHASVGLDLGIIVDTVKTVLFGIGAR